MKIKKQKGVIDMKNREKPPQFLSKNRGKMCIRDRSRAT